MEPEVVATSPYRIKSPVPVCCGFSSTKMVGERGLAPPRLTDSRSVGSAIPSEPLARNWCSQPESHRQPQPSEGCALIIELQERKNGASCRCCPSATFLQRKPAGCRKQAKDPNRIPRCCPGHSGLHETCLSAGSTATLPNYGNGAPTRSCTEAGLLTEQAHRSKCFGGVENGRRETTCTSKAAWF